MARSQGNAHAGAEHRRKIKKMEKRRRKEERKRQRETAKAISGAIIRRVDQ